MKKQTGKSGKLQNTCNWAIWPSKICLGNPARDLKGKLSRGQFGHMWRSIIGRRNTVTAVIGHPF